MKSTAEIRSELDKSKDRFYRNYQRIPVKPLREYLGDLRYFLTSNPRRNIFGLIVLTIAVGAGWGTWNSRAFERETLREDVITVRQVEMATDLSGNFILGFGSINSREKLFVISQDGRMFTVSGSFWVDSDEPHGVYAKLLPRHTYQVKLNRGDGSKEKGIPNILKIIKEMPLQPELH